jgi:hypothetical protein
MKTPISLPSLKLTGALALAAMSLAACGGDDDVGASAGDTEASTADEGDTDGPGTSATGASSGPGTTGASGTGTDGTSDDTGADDTGADDAGADDTDADDTDGSTTDPVVEEPPQVISTSPANGEIGVPIDAVIVVTFSEPMDEAATEAAWQSDDLPAADVTMSWNEAGDELTITPNEPLLYAEGDNPDTLDPLSYAATIGASARNLAGDTLEEPFTLEFSTVRSIVYSTLEAEPDLTGHLLQGSNNPNTNFIWVGDNATNLAYKGFVSIDLAGLPDDVIAFSQATLFVNHGGVAAGTPYDDLGVVNVVPIDYEDLDQDAFSATPWIDVGLLFSNSTASGWRTLDVVGFLEQSYEGDTGLSQFRLEFSFPTDDDGVPDIAHFDVETAVIIVSYTAP